MTPTEPLDPRRFLLAAFAFAASAALPRNPFSYWSFAVKPMSWIGLSLWATGLSVGLASAQTPSAARLEAGARMATAATAYLESLEPEQAEKTRKAFSEQRKDWHYVPRSRDGLSLKEMTKPQRRLVYNILRQGLSEQGVERVDDIISLEGVLQRLEGSGRKWLRDPENYHLWIFGDPEGPAWGWRFEGHHISINATVVAGQGVSMTPTFLGANPAEVPHGPRQGFRALAAEEDLAFALVESFDDGQRSQAVFESQAPQDIFTGSQRRAEPLPVRGLAFGEMSLAQQAALKELVDVFLLRNRPDIYQDALDLIESDGWESVRFGWAGPIDRDEGNYYCVQGQSFLIEYDNTQNNNNHIHTVWREFDGDFGEDLLGRHHHEHAH